MEFVAQDIEDILASLQALNVDWKDDIARRVISEIEALPLKVAYDIEDIRALLDKNFEDALLIFRLFLGQSKDVFTAALKKELGSRAAGVMSYRADPVRFLDALLRLRILDAMAGETGRVPKWSDVLVERLRSGRGSAISGQKRGRGAEDFVEVIVRKVFNGQFAPRCSFSGPRNKTAKCDFAIPTKSAPRILIESKGYGATGSKMTDIIGDIEKIIAAKRPDAAFLFFTDGLTWRQRRSDLRKIVEYQNSGDITRIYTYAMANQFESDLRQLKKEYGL
ncbi:MAG: DpnII family type II restriction endonuclease [Burkholderiales bacterium]